MQSLAQTQMQSLAQTQALSAAGVMWTHSLTIHLMSDFHLELAVDSVSGCTMSCACCTVLLKSKQKFVVCQADRPVLKCIKFIVELADLH